VCIPNRDRYDYVCLHHTDYCKTQNLALTTTIRADYNITRYAYSSEGPINEKILAVFPCEPGQKVNNARSTVDKKIKEGMANGREILDKFDRDWNEALQNDAT
jgi:hypothetical protein